MSNFDIENAIRWANVGTCSVVALLLLLAILSPRVRDGVVMKIGLIFLFGGFLMNVTAWAQGLDSITRLLSLGRGQVLINVGLAIVVLGYLWRAVRSGHPVNRITDWADLSPPDQQQHGEAR